MTRIGKIYVSDLGSVAGCLPRRLEKIAVAQVPRAGQGTPKNREGNLKQIRSVSLSKQIMYCIEPGGAAPSFGVLPFSPPATNWVQLSRCKLEPTQSCESANRNNSNETSGSQQHRLQSTKSIFLTVSTSKEQPTEQLSYCKLEPQYTLVTTG